MRPIALLTLLLAASCTQPSPPSYWHLTVPVPQLDLGEADRLIRETVVLYQEVADTWDRRPATLAKLRALLARARKVERNLSSALITYLSILPEPQEKDAFEQRRSRLQDLLTTLRAWIKDVESAL